MNPNEYQQLAMRTKCNQATANHRIANALDYRLVQLNHACLGLAGDAGELCNALARHVYYGKELDLVNVKEEIGDCLWWLAEACDAIGVTMEDMMEANIRKLQTRYPDKYTDEHAAEEGRNREAERKAIELVHDPVVGDVMIEKQIEQQERNTDPQVDLFGLPKQSNIEHLCPKCGAAIGKRMRRLIDEWLKTPVENRHAAMTCHDCGSVLTTLRQVRNGLPIDG